MYESNANISVSINEKIATITFFHPASNSFTTQMLSDLTNQFNNLSKNDLVNLIVLQSKGNGAFCAGASFDELLAIANFDQGKKFFSGFANLINAMRKCSKLIVGRIHGKAVGGGVGLASACDYVFATTNASIKLSEIAIGIGPFVIEPAVSRKMGQVAFSQLTLTPNDWQTAKWAHKKQLYTQLVDSVYELDATIQEFTQNLSIFNPEALTEIKKIFWQNTDNWDTLLYQRAEISGQLVVSNFTKNALNQFKK
jgi:methylglutaconyl-CoA hydratase